MIFDDVPLENFEGPDCRVAYRSLGAGPPLVLLHGFPQTHVMWRAVAPALASRFSLILPDLRGYGDSGKPETDAEHTPYSKRAMAGDILALMSALGHDRFDLAGHDRGGRVAHRLALDAPDRVKRLAVLDIVPTYKIFMEANRGIAMAYYHWYFLAQPYPLPEQMIGADPDFYYGNKCGSLSPSGDSFFEPAAMAEYKRCWNDPAMIHASCEDYRAAATVDLAHDKADLDVKLACPLLALWGKAGVMEREYDVLAAWRERASDVWGEAIHKAGHFLAEEQPDAVAERLLDFFTA